MTRRFLVARLSTIAVVAVAALSLSRPVASQPIDDGADPSVAISVESASPWVAASGAWSAELRVTGAPADAKVSYSIRQPPAGTDASVRDALIASRDGEDEPKVMRRPVISDLASITDAAGLTHVEIPVRSDGSGDRERILIPNSGVYPVVVTVTTAGGTALQRTTLYLNRLPAPGAAKAPTAPFRLGIVLQQPHLGGFDDEGEAEITTELRDSITSTTEVLTEADGLPVQVDLSPESIVALTQSETPGDLQLVELLRNELGSADVMRVPWADLHVEGWATSGTLPEVQTSLIDGQQALFARLQRPVATQVWPVDRSVGSAGVEMLTKVGVTAMLVEPDQLVDADAATGESGLTRPFRLRGNGDTAVMGLAVDPELDELLDTPTDSPALSAHQMITQLFGAWLADSRERGTVLRIDDSADPDVLAELFDALRTGDPETRPIAVVAPADVAALEPIAVRQSGRDVSWDRELNPPADVPRVGGIAQRLKTARPLVDDYAAIVPPNDDIAARRAIVIQRSLDQRLAPTLQETLLDTATGAIRSDLDKISASGPKSLTVTSRNTSVPLRFTNGTGRVVQVRLRLQSPRLVFTDGAEQVLTLQPGLTRLDVDIDVRASGQFVMQADLLAPESDRVLASTRQRIRSRAFSGVGLMLSGGALLFLVIWWSRTLRRRERDAEPDDGADDDVPHDVEIDGAVAPHEGPGVSASPS